jgi:hypothetical protein
MDCVKGCPVDGCLEAKTPWRSTIAPWVWPLLVVGLWVIIFGVAKATDNWNTKIAPEMFKLVIKSGLIEERTRGFFE